MEELISISADLSFFYSSIECLSLSLSLSFSPSLPIPTLLSLTRYSYNSLFSYKLLLPVYLSGFLKSYIYVILILPGQVVLPLTPIFQGIPMAVRTTYVVVPLFINLVWMRNKKCRGDHVREGDISQSIKLTIDLSLSINVSIHQALSLFVSQSTQLCSG